MRFLRHSSAQSLLTALALAVAGCGQHAGPIEAGKRPTLGLMTSLPIYWSSGDALARLAQKPAQTHWARAALEQSYRVEPLDTLAPTALDAADILILAQPRALSPLENVALDEWVRGGGRVLLFADPALVLESEYPLGDPRRPQESALLSPILRRWGLELTFDESQAPLRRVTQGDIVLDIAAAGAFERTEGEDAVCRLAAERVIAECAVGQGRVVAIADATLLEDTAGTPAGRKVLAALIARLRERAGDFSGSDEE